MERPPVGVGAREGRRAWSPVGGQEGVGVTAQQGVSHPSWLGWWGWGDDAQRPLGGEACLWSRAPRNWAGLGHPAQAWGSTWEPQRGRYCQELAPVSPTATRGAPSLAGGVAVCPWRAGHGAAWSPVQGGEALASCGGAGSRALGPHWVEGPVCGGWRCGGSRRLELWGPPLSGLHLGAPRSRVVPVHALPRWGRVLCGGCKAPSRTVTLCLQRLRLPAAATRGRSLPQKRVPSLCGPQAAGASAALRLGGWRQPRASPPPPLPAAPGASWASPAALYLDLFRARGRRSLREAGGLGLCHPRPHPTERLREKDPLKPRPPALQAGSVSPGGPRPPQPRSVASLSLPPHYAGPLLWTEGLGSMF